MAPANPSADLEFLHLNSQLSRASATPRTTAAQYNYMLRSNDVRQVLPLIQIPTLVLHVKDNPLIPIEHGRYLAEHIEGAIFVEVPGGDLALTPTNYWVIDEIAGFLTGERPVVEADRILTTVLFTDIVGSTAQAALLGDQRWRSLLDSHDTAVRGQLRRFRGREINTTGDGFVASFDGPARAIRCTQSIAEATGKLGIELRVGCTPASARSGVMILEAWPSTLPPGLERWRLRGRSWFRAWLRTWWLGRASSSATVASTNSRRARVLEAVRGGGLTDAGYAVPGPG